jgi:RHS repeat-associated protein
MHPRPLRGALRLALLPVITASLLVGITSAQSAPFAPTQTPPILDTFNRANEDPLSGGGNWARADTGSVWLAMRLVDNAARRSTSGSSMSYWTQSSFTAGTGSVWAKWGTLADPIGVSVALLKDVGGANAVDGYELRREVTGITGNDFYRLYSVTNANRTQIASTASNAPVTAYPYFNLRRVGQTVEGWASPDGVSWTSVLSVTDTAHTTGTFYPAIHVSSSGDGNSINTNVDDFGAAASAAPTGPPPEQTFGTSGGRGIHAWCGCGSFADPVNSRTGAFTTSVDDVALPGTGVSFAWTRTYTSADTTVGRLGPGWTDSYSASLDVQGNGDVLLHGEDGQQVSYTSLGAGAFSGAAGSLSTLEAITGGYELTRTDQVVYTFNSTGRLSSMEDRNGQGVTLGYDGSGKLTTVTDAAGEQATVAYSGSLVTSVTTDDGRSVAYGYTSGKLTSVTDVRGKTWTYTYDGSSRLATMVDPLSYTQVANVYGTDGRVTQQTDAVGEITTFAWNATDEIATATDARSNDWVHDYDDGILTEDIDPLANATVLAHDGDLNLEGVTSPTSETTEMTYDAAGNLLTATAPASLGHATKTFVYNARNDPTSVTDARGKVTTYTYTGAGNVDTVTQDGTQIADYSYDGDGRVLTFTDGRGKVTTYSYFSASGYLESATDPLGNETTYTYDGAGRVLTRVDPKGNCSGCTPANFTWSYTYNAAGQQLTETNPLSQTTTNVYDDAGRLTSTTDARGNTTSYTYDNANRILTETKPDPDGGGSLSAPVTTYTYDDVGNKLTETDPRGNTTTFAYDDANRLISETAPDPDGGGSLTAPVTTYTYDDNGNLASTVEPRGNLSGATPNDYRTSYTYDAAGRQLTTTDPLGNVTTNTYDAVGNLASVEDANDHLTEYTYDAAGRILTVEAPDTGVTTYTYDATGNVSTREDAEDHVTTYAYDDAGQLTTETSPDPDGGGSQSAAVTTHTYDENGNELTLTDPNGNATGTSGDGVTTYGYDRANRLTSINYSDSTPDVAYTYDAVGNRLTMTDGVSGTQTRTYDNLDRLLTLTRGTATYSYEYDAAGNVTKRTYPDNVSTFADYTYDPLGRMATVVVGSRTLSYAYDAASNLVTTTLPSQNGHVETRTYDRAGRLNRVQTVKSTTTRLDVTYTRDPVGNPLTETTTGAAPVSKRFDYDDNDRLTEVCFQSSPCSGGSDPFIRYTYDLVGNRLTEVRPTGTTTSTYDARDRLLTAGATSYTWDENGNQLSAGSRSFAYDLANRLESTTLSPTTTTYTYDGDGIRTQASTGTGSPAKTNYFWDVNYDLPQVTREASGGNSLYRRYFHGLDVLWMSTANNGNAFHFHTDPLGSVRAITSQTGATQWTYDYEPFGQTRTQTGSTPDNFVKFTGEYLDPTGLYHLRARQYDAGAGRFLSADPLHRGSSSPALSTYAYSDCRPTVLTDPSGMHPTASSAAEDAVTVATSSITRSIVLRLVAPRVCPHFSLRLFLDWALPKYLWTVGTLLDEHRTLVRVSGEVTLRRHGSSGEQIYRFRVSKASRVDAQAERWIELPGSPTSIQFQYIWPARPDAIDPNDDSSYGRGEVTLRHAAQERTLDCRYTGAFRRRR